MTASPFGVRISAIASVLPAASFSSEEAAASTGLGADIRIKKLGVRRFHVAGADEPPSELATRAIAKLCASHGIAPQAFEFLILVTQNPDYRLPTTACIVQERAGLSRAVMAYDLNQGCSGFVIALAQAHALIASGTFTRGVIVTAEVYNRVIDPGDKDTYGLFGDAAAAVCVERASEPERGPQKFFFGTDGRGAEDLIVKGGGAAFPKVSSERDGYLRMNGRAIFEFVARVLPKEIEGFLATSGLDVSQVDYWVFHQASRYMNEHLCRLLRIPAERAFFDIEDLGNTVSCTIPIALERARARGLLSGRNVVLCGFGVGLSWAGCLYRLGANGEL